MSKYNTDLDYVILGIDISREELEEIESEADKIISENKESNENLAVAYLKKAQCLRKLNIDWGSSFILYDDMGLPFEKDDECKRLLEKALELSPDMPEALMQLGLISYSLLIVGCNIDETINLFSKAIQLKPNYAAAFNNRAIIFFGSMDYYESRPIESLKDNDNFEKAKIDSKNAIVDLTEAIKIRPYDALYHLYRGTLHSKLGEHKEAAEDFSSAIKYASEALKIDYWNKVFLMRTN